MVRSLRRACRSAFASGVCNCFSFCVSLNRLSALDIFSVHEGLRRLEKNSAVKNEQPDTTQTKTQMGDKADEVKATAAEGTETLTVTAATTPSRKRYSRAELMKLRESKDLSLPPVGYNPAILRPMEPQNKDMSQMLRDGSKWNRSRSMGWAAQNQGPKGGIPFSRLMEGQEEAPNGPPRGGRALRPAISWNEQHSGSAPTSEKIPFGRRNSRSDAPGRWDNNKDDQLSKSLEKRGPEKWSSYGHRGVKDKPSKPTEEEECIETDNPPQEMPPYRGHEPEWMHHRPSAENAERIKQQRQFAADFEEERKLMREKIAKDSKALGDTGRGDSGLFMTEEEINEYKKELEAEERGVSSAPFTFDSLKEAMKSQGVSNLPPMPTTGISTVDQIEKTLRATAQQQQQRFALSDLERQKLELLKAVSGQQGVMPNPQVAGNMEGANRLLSMLRGQARPALNTMNPAVQLQQPLGGFPMNLPQQQGLFPGGNTQLERLFAANPRMGPNLSIPGYNAQQPQVHPGMGGIPFMQQAGQFSQRPQQNPLLSALLANQQAQNVRQKQAQMMAQLQQAQQQTALQNARAEAAAAAGHESGDEDGEGKGNTASGPVQPGMMGLLPGVTGGAPNQVPLPSFGLQGSLVGARPSMPSGPGMFNPSVGNMPVGNPQENFFPGGIGPGGAPGGLGGHPGFFMQNGGGMGRPVAPGLAGLNLTGVRPGMGNPLGSMMDDRQLPVLNGQPNALQASLLAAQQQSSGAGLTRFFGEHNVGAPGGFPADPPTVTPARNRSLEELKNEAQ